jgi:hypothetical protein
MINSANAPAKKRGMIYLVGRAAKVVTNTSTNGTIAAIFKGKFKSKFKDGK